MMVNVECSLSGFLVFSPIQDEVVYCQRLMPAANISKSNRPKRAFRMRPRLKSRFSIVARNIKATRKSKPRQCMRLPKLTDEEALQVDEILGKCRAEEIKPQTSDGGTLDEPMVDTSNYYQLSGNERQRLATLNAALGTHDEREDHVQPTAPVVRFADDLPTHKMMQRNDRKRIDCIDEELDVMAMEKPSSSALTVAQLECADDLNADDYSKFRAKRIVNFAFDVTDAGDL